jgi:hypothetical protein
MGQMKRRAHWLAIAVACVAPAQDRPEPIFQQGSLTVTVHPGELELRVGSRVRRIDINKLPIHAADCEYDEVEKDCTAKKEDPCVACIGSPDIVAWDEARQVV